MSSFVILQIDLQIDLVAFSLVLMLHIVHQRKVSTAVYQGAFSTCFQLYHFHIC